MLIPRAGEASAVSYCKQPEADPSVTLRMTFVGGYFIKPVREHEASWSQTSSGTT
jgi:hypothetical protein